MLSALEKRSILSRNGLLEGSIVEMLSGRLCLRLPRTVFLTPSIPRHNVVSPSIMAVRHATTKRKKKVGKGEFVEKESERRLRLKRKREKEMAIKRKKYEKVLAQKRAQFKLAPHTPRPDSVPYGTAMALLRGWGAKQSLFVRSAAASWAPETKIVAMVRVVPNDHNPRGIKGRVQFPHPVVSSNKESKKERVAVIAVGDKVEEAKKAGMIVGGKEYLDQVC